MIAAGNPVGSGADAGLPDGDGAVLVLRVWLEPAGSQRLRARLLSVGEGGPASLAVAAGPAEICAEVSRWLQSVDTRLRRQAADVASPPRSGAPGPRRRGGRQD